MKNNNVAKMVFEYLNSMTLKSCQTYTGASAKLLGSFDCRDCHDCIHHDNHNRIFQFSNDCGNNEAGDGNGK